MSEESELLTVPAPFSKDELEEFVTPYRTTQAYLCGLDISPVSNFLLAEKRKEDRRRDAIIFLGKIWGALWRTPVEYYNTEPRISEEDLVKTHKDSLKTQQLAVRRTPHTVSRY
jgi:hypothetical protein